MVVSCVRIFRISPHHLCSECYVTSWESHTSFLSNLLPVLPHGKSKVISYAIPWHGNSWRELGRIQLGKPKDLQNQLSLEVSYGLEVIFLLPNWIKNPTHAHGEDQVPWFLSCVLFHSASHSPSPLFQGCSSQAERRHAGDTILWKEALPGGQAWGQPRGLPTSLPALGMPYGLPGILPCGVTMPWTGGLLLRCERRLISCAVMLHKTHCDPYSKPASPLQPQLLLLILSLCGVLLHSSPGTRCVLAVVSNLQIPSLLCFQIYPGSEWRGYGGHIWHFITRFCQHEVYCLSEEESVYACVSVAWLLNVPAVNNWSHFVRVSQSPALLITHLCNCV